MLDSGQRRSDVVRIRWQHVRGDKQTIRANDIKITGLNGKICELLKGQEQ